MQPSNSPSSDVERKNSRPMSLLCLAFMAGIISAKFFNIPLIAVLFALLLILMAWFAALRKITPHNRDRFILPMLIITMMCLGFTRMEILVLSWKNHERQIGEISNRMDHQISGRVDEIYDYDTGNAKVLLSEVSLAQDGRDISLSGNLELWTASQKTITLKPGQRISTHGRITPIGGPQVPTGMNHQEYRYSQGIYASVFVDTNTDIVSSKENDWGVIRPWAYQAINQAEYKLPQSSWTPPPEKTLGLISSIAYGIRSNMPSNLRESLSRSGLAHITSISGLHVSLILYMLFWMLKFSGFRRKHAAIITFHVGIIYLFLVGLRIPTLRAVLMGYVFLGQYLVQRKVDPLNSLGFAGLILLLLNPAELFLPSFQLSFTAVLFLILYQPMHQFIQSWPLWLPFRYLIRCSMASAVVVMGLAPFTIYYFHHFTWGAIPGNLLAVPVVSLFLPLTYIWSFCAWFDISLLTNSVGWSVNACAWALIHITEFFGGEPLFYWQMANPGALLSTAFFLALLLLSRPTYIWWQTKALKFQNLHAALALFALALFANPLLQQCRPLRVDFAGLGQGDCTLIQTPQGHTLLVDGGPPPRANRAQPLLVDYLLSQGIRRIDVMAVTHPQADHIGAFEAVADTLPVRLVIEGATQADIQTHQSFIQKLKEKSIPRQPVIAGDKIQIGDELTAWVLHPNSEILQQDIDVNEKSIVLFLQYKELDILLTGDIGHNTEEELNARYENWDADILKVAHHGSRYSTSTAFLAETTPEFAVIQVGRNPYGHPHSSTRYRLAEQNIHLIRTDRDGTARLQSDGKRFRIYTTGSNRLYVHKMPKQHVQSNTE